MESLKALRDGVKEFIRGDVFIWIHLALTVVLLVLVIVKYQESFRVFVDHQSAALPGQRVDSTGVGGLVRYNEFSSTNQGYSNAPARAASYMMGRMEPLAANSAEGPVVYPLTDFGMLRRDRRGSPSRVDASDLAGNRQALAQAIEQVLDKREKKGKEGFQQVGSRFVDAPENFSVEDSLARKLHGE